MIFSKEQTDAVFDTIVESNNLFAQLLECCASEIPQSELDSIVHRMRENNRVLEFFVGTGRSRDNGMTI